MRHGTKLRFGFKVGDRVKVTSRRLCFAVMPGVVTGDSPEWIRVRIGLPWTVNVVFSVWVKPSELRKARAPFTIRAARDHRPETIEKS